MERQFFVVGCGSVTTALGKVDCGKFKGLPKGFIFTTEDFYVDLGDKGSAVEVVDALNDASIAEGAALPAVTAYYPNLVNLEPSGGEPNIVTEGFGGGVPNGLTAKSEVYTITDGGICMFGQLSALKGRDLRVMLVDENDIAYGTIDKSGRFKGFQAFAIPYLRDNTGTETGAILLMLQYKTSYEKELDNQAQVALDEEVNTLREITLSEISISGSPKKIYFKASTSCGGTSVTKNGGSISSALTSKMSAGLAISGGFLNVRQGGSIVAGTVSFDSSADRFTFSPTQNFSSGVDVELSWNGTTLVNTLPTDAIFTPFVMGIGSRRLPA